jgi:hypothetical protein
MSPSFDPFRLLLITLAGWMSQQHHDVVDYSRKRIEFCANNSATNGSA